MANILPTDLFSGYELVAAAGTVTAESICIPLADLPALSLAEADELTGDGREVVRAFDLAVTTALNALPIEERPARMQYNVVTSNLPNGNRQVAITKTYELSAPLELLNMTAE